MTELESCRRVVALLVRTHRRALVGWPLLIGGLVAATATSIPAVYDTPESRAAYEGSIGRSVVSFALNGRAHDLDTVGGIVVYELGFYAILVFPLIAIHLTIRLTRGEEEAGRVELLTAAPVGRVAPLAAGALCAAASMLAAGALAAAGLLAAGLDTAGTLTYSVALTVSLMMFTAVGLVAAQLSGSSRGAHGVALGALGLAFVARAAADARAAVGSNARWPVWINPTAWLSEVGPFGTRRVWPVVALAATTIVLGVVAVGLRRRRDLGAGLLTERRGQLRAAARLGTPPGLLWRMNRGAVIGWAIGVVIWSAAFGLMVPEMAAIVESTPAIEEMLGGSATPEALVGALSALMTALLATAMVVQSIGQAAGDEQAGRLGLLLSTPLARRRWATEVFAVAAVAAAAVMVLGGLANGAAMAASLRDVGALGPPIGASVAYLPAVATCEALTVLAWCVSARLAALGWVLVGWAAIVGLLGETLRLPAWARALSPLWHVGAVPRVPVSAGATAALCVLAALVTTAAAGALRARDVSYG